MPNLVIVESPAKASTIKSYLGSGYKVVASKGHVRDLPKSKLGVDIEDNFKAHYINIRGKGPLIKELKKEAKASDKIYLAADPDREGEAISWHLAAALDIPVEDTRRVSFNEITKTAVKAAIKKPRAIDMNLVNAQQARRILDRIVGYKLSPFLWKTIHGGLSAGRVQSVATRIIVEREAEIRAFVPVEYWTIDCKFKTDKNELLNAKFYGNKDGKLELRNENEAQNVFDSVKDGPFAISSIKKATRLKNPTPPFITSTLQQEASRKLGFQSQRIMKTAQELYEGVNIGSENGGVQGLITYMRTDSTRVSEEAVHSAKEYIIEKFGDKYYPAVPRVYKSKNSAQDAHEAIRPSNINIEPDAIKKSLTPDQYKLYKLIWSRFTASQMVSAELDTVSAEIQCSGYIFRASGYTVKFNGYLAVYDDTENTASNESVNNAMEKAALPELKEGERLTAEKIEPNRHFTEPAPRYSEASLIKFLEEKGIGRPSTYTPIITTIITRGYVEREGRALKPTPLGEITTELMKNNFADVVDYEFTAQMEEKLDDIENGMSDMISVLGEFYNKFEKNLIQADKSVANGDIKIPVEETDITCEKCGRTMVIKNGRYGKFAACPGYPECKNTKPLTPDGSAVDSSKTEKTDVKCDLCGSDMIMKTGRYGNFLACCKYPDCKNTKQLHKETGVLCPVCKGKILIKRSKKSVFYSCENYNTCKFSSWDLPVDEKCPDCGEMLFVKKGKNQIICHNKECGYKRDSEPIEPKEDLQNAAESET
ncbi:MAG: type I DNA topoisomerase [Eubacteriales bacterium]|nr:type I DNA topoisomerase [Eubacteriales bacterium]